jgi:hypothetical protein
MPAAWRHLPRRTLGSTSAPARKHQPDRQFKRPGASRSEPHRAVAMMLRNQALEAQAALGDAVGETLGRMPAFSQSGSSPVCSRWMIACS